MTVVDAVVRLAGMGAKALVVVAARAAPEERCRRRGQVRRPDLAQTLTGHRAQGACVCGQALCQVCGATTTCMCLHFEALLWHALLPLLACFAQAHWQ